MKSGTQIMLTLLGQPDGMEHDKIFDALVTRFQRYPTWESKMWFFRNARNHGNEVLGYGSWG